MPNLQQELRDLVLADEHVAMALKGLSDMHANLEAQRAAGGDTAVFEQSLALAEEALVQFRTHRDLIAARIADIRSGALPGT